MKIKILISSTVLACASSVALAGFVQPAPVDVDLVNGTASGDMRTAREAKNDLDFIGCGLRRFDNGVSFFEFGFCQAQDADEEQITCFTQNPSLLETMRATADFSFITFSWVEGGDLGDFECTRVGFSTQSFYLPKK